MTGHAAPTTALVLAASLLAAGCLAATPGGTAPAQADASCQPGPRNPDVDFGSAVTETHDHSDPSLHTSAHNLELLGHTPIWDPGTAPGLPGGYFELAIAGDWALVSNMGPQRGFSIVDISDPAAPRPVSAFHVTEASPAPPVGAGSHWDVSVFPGGDLAVLSAQALANPPTTDRPDQAGGGIYLVNITDKEDPTVESFTQVIEPDSLIPVGVHNANPFQVDGTWYVAATTANGWTYLYRVTGQAPDRDLGLVTRIDGIHDQAVQTHPITDETLLYTATSNGVLIWKIDDPADPELLSTIDVPAYHETIPSDVLVDGRHYTVTTTESAQGSATPFTLIDTTDPRAPEEAGQWILPGEPSSPGFYTFSGHNLDFEAGRLIIGHYHAGVWIVDVSTDQRVHDPQPIAMYEPHEDPLFIPRTSKGVDRPSVWRATLHNGTVWASDTNTGLYALEYTGPDSPLKCEGRTLTNIR